MCIPLSHVGKLSTAAAYITNTAAPTPALINSSHVYAVAIAVGSVSGCGLLVLLAFALVIIIIVFRCKTKKGIIIHILVQT